MSFSSNSHPAFKVCLFFFLLYFLSLPTWRRRSRSALIGNGTLCASLCVAAYHVSAPAASLFIFSSQRRQRSTPPPPPVHVRRPLFTALLSAHIFHPLDDRKQRAKILKAAASSRLKYIGNTCAVLPDDVTFPSDLLCSLYVCIYTNSPRPCGHLIPPPTFRQTRATVRSPEVEQQDEA